MRAAILTIGDELTCGYRLDTNSQVIAQRLAAVPLDVVLHLTVGDNPKDIQEGLHTALETADVVVVAGGLGPTEDDLTRQTVAAFFDRPLVEDDEALRHIRERYARRGRPMPERNLVQALVPQGSRTIHNDRGTAAGFYLQKDGQHLFVVPGVPYEMRGMLEGFILPRLYALAGSDATVRRGALKLLGPTESEVAENIQAMLARDRNPLLGLLPQRGVITVEVVARGTTPSEAERLLAADLATLREVFGKAVLCQDERDLAQVLVDLLAEKKLTLAVAEATGGTGGLVVARLTGAEGSERWLRRGSVVKAGTSAAETEELATEIRQDAGTAVGLATGALIRPCDAPADRPYGAIYAAVAVRDNVSSHRLSYSGERERIRQLAAEAALGLLRLRIAAPAST